MTLVHSICVRRRLGLSVSLVGMFIGSGLMSQEAYAENEECSPSGGTIVCGIGNTGIGYAGPNLKIVAGPDGMSSTTASGHAVSLTGYGDLSFDNSVRSIVAGDKHKIEATGSTPALNYGIYIKSENAPYSGCCGGIQPGSVNAIIFGEVYGVAGGVYAENATQSGPLAITTLNSSKIVASIGEGIKAINDGSELSITTGHDSTVEGYGLGVGGGISASNSGVGDLSIRTGRKSITKGDAHGIYASNETTGKLSIDTGVDSEITGKFGYGIQALNSKGSDLTITTGDASTAGASTVYGFDVGISAENSGDGTGVLSIKTGRKAIVTGESGTGITASNKTKGNLLIETGVDSKVIGKWVNGNGILAENSGSGDLLIVTGERSAVTSDQKTGISATNSGNGDLSVKTGVNSKVSGDGRYGIQALNANGTNLTITTGDASTPDASQVVGALAGIYAENTGSGAGVLSIKTGRKAFVNGLSGTGITALNKTKGNLLIETGVDSEVTGLGDYGISALNSNGSDLTITTGDASTADASTVFGLWTGIYAKNSGSGTGGPGTGALTIKTGKGAKVTGRWRHGIQALNSNGTDLTITTGDASTADASTVSGYDAGISAENSGDGKGDLSIKIGRKAKVTGEDGIGISASNETKGNLLIETGVDSQVTGNGDYGIKARNSNGSDLTITIGDASTADASAVSGASDGIYAENSGDGAGVLSITTGKGAKVTGESGNAVSAINRATGNLSIETGAASEVTSKDGRGIMASSHAGPGGVTLNIGDGSTVQGGEGGISALIHGSGTGTISITTGKLSKVIATQTPSGELYPAIWASGNRIALNTGEGSEVSGMIDAIYMHNSGSGEGSLSISTGRDSTVTAVNGSGLRAWNSGKGDLSIETGERSTVTSSDGISASNFGTGSLLITTGVHSKVIGKGNDGIKAENLSGTNLTIDVSDRSEVSGWAQGISATNSGSGTGVLSIETGELSKVNGGTGAGIFASNAGSGGISITTGKNSSATGRYGLRVHSPSVITNSPKLINITNYGSVEGKEAAISLHTGDTANIINNGSLKNSSNSAGDLAIDFHNSSPVFTEGKLENNGSLRGRVDLTNSYNFTVTNAANGRWETSGESSFGYGGSSLVNSGALQASGSTSFTFSGDSSSFTNDGKVDLLDSTAFNFIGSSSSFVNDGKLKASGSTSFNVSGDSIFTNRGNGSLDLSGSTAFNFGGSSSSFTNSGILKVSGTANFTGLKTFDSNTGTIDMGNGEAGDELALPVEAYRPGGVILLDVLTSNEASKADMLVLQGDSAASDVSGVTKIRLNYLNQQGDNDPAPIRDLVLVKGEEKLPAGSFELEGGPISRGLFFTDNLVRSGDDLILESQFKPEAEVLPPPVPPPSVITVDAEPKLDAAMGVGVPGVERPSVDPGPYVQNLGSAFSADTEGTLRDGDKSYRVDVPYDMSVMGIIAGVDRMQKGTSASGSPYAWIVGGFGGYVISNATFEDRAGSQQSYGGVAGVYAALGYAQWRFHLAVKTDFGVTDVATGSDSDSATYLSPGVAFNAGYKYQLSPVSYLQPIATLSYVHRSLGDVSLEGTDISYDDTDSLRGRIGFRLGSFSRGETHTIEPWMQASLWHEFSGESQATFTGASGALDFTGLGAGTFAEVGGGVNVLSQTVPGLSGSMRTELSFGERSLLGLSGKLGVEYRFPVK